MPKGAQRKSKRVQSDKTSVMRHGTRLRQGTSQVDSDEESSDEEPLSRLRNKRTRSTSRRKASIAEESSTTSSDDSECEQGPSKKWAKSTPKTNASIKSPTSRSSERIKAKRNREFHMPSREDVLRKIETSLSPHKSHNHLQPRRLVNNFMRVHHRYNHDPDYTSGESSLEDFIVSDDYDEDRKKKSSRKKEESSDESDSDGESDSGTWPDLPKTKGTKRHRRISQPPVNDSSSDDDAKINKKKRKRVVRLDQESSEDSSGSDVNGHHVVKKQHRASVVESDDSEGNEKSTTKDCKENEVTTTSKSTTNDCKENEETTTSNQEENGEAVLIVDLTEERDENVTEQDKTSDVSPGAQGNTEATDCLGNDNPCKSEATDCLSNGKPCKSESIDQGLWDVPQIEAKIGLVKSGKVPDNDTTNKPCKSGADDSGKYPQTTDENTGLHVKEVSSPENEKQKTPSRILNVEATVIAPRSANESSSKQETQGDHTNDSKSENDTKECFSNSLKNFPAACTSCDDTVHDKPGMSSPKTGVKQKAMGTQVSEALDKGNSNSSDESDGDINVSMSRKRHRHSIIDSDNEDNSAHVNVNQNQTWSKCENDDEGSSGSPIFDAEMPSEDSDSESELHVSSSVKKRVLDSDSEDSDGTARRQPSERAQLMEGKRQAWKEKFKEYNLKKKAKQTPDKSKKQ